MHRRVNWCVRPIIWFRPAARCLGKYLHLANLDLHHACLTHRRRKSKKSILPDLRSGIENNREVWVASTFSINFHSCGHQNECSNFLSSSHILGTTNILETQIYHYQSYSLISTIHFLIGKRDEAGAMQVRHP